MAINNSIFAKKISKSERLKEELEEILGKSTPKFLEWAIGVKFVPFSFLDFIQRWNARHVNFQLNYLDEPEEFIQKLVHLYKNEMRGKKGQID